MPHLALGKVDIRIVRIYVAERIPSIDGTVNNGGYVYTVYIWYVTSVCRRASGQKLA